MSSFSTEKFILGHLAMNAAIVTTFDKIIILSIPSIHRRFFFNRRKLYIGPIAANSL